MIYWFTRYAAYLILKIFFSLKIKGLENIPRKGAFIIASNHTSNLDPIAVGASCNRKVNFMGKEELFKNKIFASYLNKLNVFPLRRYASDSRALREAIRRLKNDAGLLLFPEGTRSKDGDIKEAKIGVSVLSVTARAPVVPCYIKGSNKIWPSKSHFFHKGKLQVLYGRPLLPPVVKKDAKKENYYEFAQVVMSHIKTLKEISEKVQRIREICVIRGL